MRLLQDGLQLMLVINAVKYCNRGIQNDGTI